MSLKFEIGVDDFGSLDESVKGFYQEHGEGSYRLAVEGIDPADELKEALRKEREERKSLADKAKQFEEQHRKAESERLKEKEDFKTLFEREQEEKRQLLEKHQSFEQQIQQRDITSAASLLGAELSKDNRKAALLAKEAKEFTRFTPDGIKFEIGGIEVTRDQLKTHLSKEFDFVCDAQIGSGSGATGSNSGAVKTLTREQFDSKSPVERMKFTKEGGKII